MVPVQTRVSQVWLALQEGRRPLHPLTEVVVVVTECRLHANYMKVVVHGLSYKPSKSFKKFMFKEFKMHIHQTNGTAFLLNSLKTDVMAVFM